MHKEKAVKFKNLLEEDFDDLQIGILNDDGTVSCLCGCDGIFEVEDYKIVDYICDDDVSE